MPSIILNDLLEDYRQTTDLERAYFAMRTYSAMECIQNQLKFFTDDDYDLQIFLEGRIILLNRLIDEFNLEKIECWQHNRTELARDKNARRAKIFRERAYILQILGRL